MARQQHRRIPLLLTCQPAGTETRWRTSRDGRQIQLDEYEAVDSNGLPGTAHAAGRGKLRLRWRDRGRARARGARPRTPRCGRTRVVLDENRGSPLLFSAAHEHTVSSHRCRAAASSGRGAGRAGVGRRAARSPLHLDGRSCANRYELLTHFTGRSAIASRDVPFQVAKLGRGAGDHRGTQAAGGVPDRRHDDRRRCLPGQQAALRSRCRHGGVEQERGADPRRSGSSAIRVGPISGIGRWWRVTWCWR